MKHAGQVAISRLEDVLAELRGIDALKEKRPGVFYRRSKAFLHFHEDPAGLFADVRLSAEDFTRMAVNTAAERKRLVKAVRNAIGDSL